MEVHSIKETVHKTMASIKTEVIAVEKSIKKDVMTIEDKIIDNVDAEISSVKDYITNVKNNVTGKSD